MLSLLLILLLEPAPFIRIAVSGLLKRELHGKCKEYCDSKRPVGEEGEFHADCEVDGSSTANSCLAACMTNDCDNCPNGKYVICPALPSPSARTAPVHHSRPDSETNGNFVWIWIVVVIFVVVVMMVGVVGLVLYCRKKRRRNYQQQNALGLNLGVLQTPTTITHFSAATTNPQPMILPNPPILFSQPLVENSLAGESQDDARLGYHPQTADM